MSLRWLVVACLIAASAFGAACGGDGDAGEPTLTPSEMGDADEAAVRALLVREFTLFKTNVGRELYDLYTPAFQQSCSFDRFVAAKSPKPEDQFRRDGLGIENLRAVVDGDTARLTYDYTIEGEAGLSLVTASNPDVFVKIDGRWYDEIDDHTNCSE